MGGVREGLARSEDADADTRGEGGCWEEDESADAVRKAADAAFALGPVVGGEEGLYAWVMPCSLASCSCSSCSLISLIPLVISLLSSPF